MIGRNIGGCIVLRELGRGTYGVVYLAHLEADEEMQVAIKVVRPSQVNQPQFVEALRQECRQLHKMHHRSVVGFRHLVVGDDLVAMIIEYLEGEDLHDFIAKHRPPNPKGKVSIPDAVRIIDGALDGLAYAHGRGVVHRDIKPSNIYVCTDGRVTLLDFGIARATQGSQGSMTGTLKGTLDYMAPERFNAQGGGAVSDVYSMGLVAWEVLTGNVACQGQDLPSKWGWHHGVSMPDVRDFRPDCPDWLAEQIVRMSRNESAQRPPDGGAALKQFRAASAGGHRPPLPPPPVEERKGPDTVQLPKDEVQKLIDGLKRDEGGAADTSDGEELEVEADEFTDPVITVIPPTELDKPPNTARGRANNNSLWLGIAGMVLLGFLFVLGLVGWFWPGWVWPKSLDDFAEHQTACVDDGYAPACAAAALALVEGANGWGPPNVRLLPEWRPDEKQAGHFLDLGCELGDWVSCVARATAYQSGTGVEVNDELGFQQWRGLHDRWKMSCDAGDSEACRWMALFYIEEISGDLPREQIARIAGIDRKLDSSDQRKALTKRFSALLNQACTAGDAPACFGVAAELQVSVLSPNAQHRQDVLAAFQRSCEGGFGPACNAVGDMYLEKTDKQPADPDSAHQWFSRACNDSAASKDSKSLSGQPYLKRCGPLWRLYAEDGPKQDEAAAFQIAQMECHASQPARCGRLGRSYLLGVGVPKSLTKALEVYAEGCRVRGQCRKFRLLVTELADGSSELPKNEKGAAIAFKSYASAVEVSCKNGWPKGCSALHGVADTLLDGDESGYRFDVKVEQAPVRAAELSRVLRDGLERQCGWGGSYRDQCYELADLYDDGFADIKIDVDKKESALRRACEAGHPKSCRWLVGLAEKRFDGSEGAGAESSEGPKDGDVPKDRERARGLYTFVEEVYRPWCKNGQLDACEDLVGLAEVYTEESGFFGMAGTILYDRLRKNYTDSCGRQASSLNGAASCVALSELYLTGKGGKKDVAGAEKLLREVCGATDQAGCRPLHTLAMDYWGSGSMVATDDPKAAQLMAYICRNAVDELQTKTCLLVGGWYQIGAYKVVRDTKEALSLYKVGCNAGSDACCSKARGLSGDPAGRVGTNRDLP